MTASDARVPPRPLSGDVPPGPAAGPGVDSIALDRLLDAARRAFPAREDLHRLQGEGTLADLWHTLAHRLGIDEARLAEALAPVMGVAVADLGQVEADALALVSLAFCTAHAVLPLALRDGQLCMASAMPLDDAVDAQARFHSGRPIRWLLAGPQALEDATVNAYARAAERAAREAQQQLGAGAATADDPVVALARSLLVQALRQRASDLHIQPYLGASVVRIRVDGALRRLSMLPDALAATLIRHIKALAGMQSSNDRVPQDGRLSIILDDQDVDLRISTLPASRGERLVIRFLIQNRVYRLADAGFSLAALQALRRCIARPSGLIVLTGPTGCGKTSTLYGLLNELNQPRYNLITVENPVEFRLPGVSQVEVNDKAGLSFAAALRSILRQDPDVILIGEIRDGETAEIATQAALTGHLVLSTLHTNDAITAIPRLLNLGVQPAVLADALVAVAAQRLCRRLCVHCKGEVLAPLSVIERRFVAATRNHPGARAVGCAHCDFTGYRGRLPIIDLVEVSPALREAIAGGETRASEFERLSRDGLRSFAVSGAMRVISGETTASELLGVLGPLAWPELAGRFGGALEPVGEVADEGATGRPLDSDFAEQVLVIGGSAATWEACRQPFAAAGLGLLQVADAEAAAEALRRNDRFAFIIGEVPEHASLEQAIALLQHNRRHIAWARLPAAVLLPPTLAAGIASLRATGVMGEILLMPVAPIELQRLIRRAQAT